MMRCIANWDVDVQAPDYHEIQAVLGDAEGGSATAEAHGTLGGVMCGRSSRRVDRKYPG